MNIIANLCSMANYNYSRSAQKVRHVHSGAIPVIEINQNSVVAGKTYMQGNGLVELNGKMTKASFRYNGKFTWYKPERITIQSCELSILGAGSVTASELSWNFGRMSRMPIQKFLKQSLQGNDRIIGSQFNDKIRGYGGDDVIDGGSGKNILIGDKGRDTFILDKQGLQVIKDFRFDYDELGLSKVARLGGKLDFREEGRDVHLYKGNLLLAILENPSF